MGITFTPLAPREREQLEQALHRNAGDGAALLTDRRDTTFRGEADDLPDDTEVVTAIRSVPCHYSDERIVQLALKMLCDSPEYAEDARQGAPVGNSVIGSLLSLLHNVPRQYAEPAVLRALKILDGEGASHD